MEPHRSRPGTHRRQLRSYAYSSFLHQQLLLPFAPPYLNNIPYVISTCPFTASAPISDCFAMQRIRPQGNGLLPLPGEGYAMSYNVWQPNSENSFFPPLPAAASSIRNEPTSLQNDRKDHNEKCSSSTSTSPLAHNTATILGKKTFVKTNYFMMDLSKARSIYHYNLLITSVPGPEDVGTQMPKALALAIMKAFVLQYQAKLGGKLLVFDGNQVLYTAKPLSFESFECFVDLTPPHDLNPKRYGLRVRLVEWHPIKDLSHDQMGQDVLTPLGAVLRENPFQKCTAVGKHYFSKDFHVASLSNPTLVAISGFAQRLHPTTHGLALKVDIYALPFCRGMPVIEYLKGQVPGFNPNQEMSSRIYKCVESILYKLKVEVTHHESKRRYIIAGLSVGRTEELVLSCEEDGLANMQAFGRMTVVQHFKETYNYTITYLKLPCLKMKAGRTTYLPMEVCKISDGQKYVGKLSQGDKYRLRELNNMEPRKRQEVIRTIMHHEFGPAKGEVLAEFGVSVSTEPVMVAARQLPPPTLKYGAAQELTPDCDAGKWSMTDGSVRLSEGCRVNEWAIVSFDMQGASELMMRVFATKLRERASELGVYFTETPALEPLCFSPDVLAIPRKLEQCLLAIHGACKKPLQLLVCLMRHKHANYGVLKKYCEVDLGIVTQCCLTSNCGKTISCQLLSNLVLKINAKLGGRNVALAFDLPPKMHKPTIIFGADVSHPSPRDDTSPSIAAVVASSDWPYPARYIARMRAQQHRMEIIDDLTGMVKELLECFHKNVKHLPEGVLFFRDGVSEDQFADVLEKELKMLKKALSEVGGEGYEPKVTLVLVQKRHNTRLFPMAGDGVGTTTGQAPHMKNVLPGTVVDTLITHSGKDMRDFFLCSHAGERGTSKPAHYHVLLDEMGFQLSELQRLVYNLCYTYTRCTRSLSIPPPVQYAHLAALRVHQYLAAHYHNQPDRSSINPGLFAVHKAVKDKMFYS